MNLPQWRADYPRPQFVRSGWLILNDTWEFEFDDEDAGEREGWHLGPKGLSGSIQVPFCFQSPLSGIGTNEIHDIVWYRRRVERIVRSSFPSAIWS